MVRFEINRTLTGMGHERYLADRPVDGDATTGRTGPPVVRQGWDRRPAHQLERDHRRPGQGRVHRRHHRDHRGPLHLLPARRRGPDARVLRHRRGPRGQFGPPLPVSNRCSILGGCWGRPPLHRSTVRHSRVSSTARIRSDGPVPLEGTDPPTDRPAWSGCVTWSGAPVRSPWPTSGPFRSSPRWSNCSRTGVAAGIGDRVTGRWVPPAWPWPHWPVPPGQGPGPPASGLRALGWSAAAELGVDLDHVVAVRVPDRSWTTVMAALSMPSTSCCAAPSTCHRSPRCGGSGHGPGNVVRCSSCSPVMPSPVVAGTAGSRPAASLARHRCVAPGGRVRPGRDRVRDGADCCRAGSPCRLRAVLL